MCWREEMDEAFVIQLSKWLVSQEISCCSSVVEHFLGKEEVGSSILLNSSKTLIIKGFKRD